MKRIVCCCAALLAVACAWGQMDSIPDGAVPPGDYRDRARLWERGEDLRARPGRCEGDVAVLAHFDTLSFDFRLNGALFMDTETVQAAGQAFTDAFNQRVRKRYRKELTLVNEPGTSGAWRGEYGVYSVHEPDCEMSGLFCLYGKNGVVAAAYATGYGAGAPDAETNLPVVAGRAGAYLADVLARALGWGR